MEIFHAQGITHTLNALSKRPNDPDCTQAAQMFATSIRKRGLEFIETFKIRHKSNALNALAKWPEEEIFMEAV